jgi:hypothetical protein
VAVHYVRAVRYLFGEPDTIYATRADQGKKGTSEDNVSFILGSAAGWQATLSCSWQASAGHCPELIVMGSRGSLKIWPKSDRIDVYPQAPTLRTRLLSRIRPWWLRSLLSSPEDQRYRVSMKSTIGLATRRSCGTSWEGWIAAVWIRNQHRPRDGIWRSSWQDTSRSSATFRLPVPHNRN